MKKKSTTLKSWLSVVLGSAMAIGATSAQALTEVESNDTFGTANAANAGSGVKLLNGSIGDASAVSNDVDIYSISLGAGQEYSASINYTGLFNPIDANPILNLFMEDNGQYFSVAASDSFGGPLNFTAWASGNYFLAVTADFNNGEDAFGNNTSMFQFMSTEATQGTSWNNFAGNSFTSFDYSVTSAVPEPAVAMLLGGGLFALVGASRRRAKQA